MLDSGAQCGTCCQRLLCVFFFQAEDGIRDLTVTGVQTCALLLVSHELGVDDRVERAARAVRDRITVAEQLHGGADDLVPGLHEQRGRHGRVHPARHGDQHAVVHRCRTADKARTLSTIAGSAPATTSTSSAALSFPNEKRNAATPSSRGTPIAVSTWDGSTAPVLQAEPDEQAMPAS